MDQGYNKTSDTRAYLVKDILGKVPNLNRIYHVSLANMTGRVGDSVAMVEHKQIKSNQT